MTVPFLDLRAAHVELQAEIDEAIARVTARSRFVLGEELAAFEEEYARYVGSRHCIGVGSGLDAIELALCGLGVGPGDEVLVPAHTFIATWLAVSNVGAIPVPVEPDPVTFNIDPARAARAVTPRTRAIVPVHLYGRPADMDLLGNLGDEHGLMIVEDAAQAHGARWRDRRVGTFGNAAAWSFYPGKNLGAFGDGGAVTTDDTDLAATLRLLRNYGSARKYVHRMRGRNSRLDELQAAVLRVKLGHLDEWNRRRSLVAARYRSALATADLTLPQASDDAESVWHLYVVRHGRRDALAAHLAERGVSTQIHYPIAPHLQDAFAHLGLGRGSLPLTERTQDEVLSLPIGPHLDPSQQQQVIDGVLSFPPVGT